MGTAVCSVEVKHLTRERISMRGSRIRRINRKLNEFYLRDLEDTIEQTIGDKPKTNNFYAKDIVQQNSVSI